MTRNRPPRMPTGSKGPFGITPINTTRPGFWEKMQAHFDDDPKWDGTLDSQFFLPATILPQTTLVRVTNLPLSVSLCVVLTATSGNTPIGGPAPPPAVPWFTVSFGTEGAQYRYSAFTGIEIGGGTGVQVDTISFDTGGTDHKLRAAAFICTAPPAMNVIQVL